MRKVTFSIIAMIFGVWSHLVFAGCAFQAAVAGNITSGPFIAELLDDQGNVYAKLGPMGAGQQQTVNINCPANSVHSIFVNSNLGYTYPSANSVMMNQGQQATCGLNNTYSYTLYLKQCAGCLMKK